MARSAKLAPKNATRPSFNSIHALTRLLTPANRQLLATIRDRKPQAASRKPQAETIAELAEITGRAQPT
ncbi:MAG: hypothetical protein JO326_03135 [Acetobacteraceae bacterium]|nr:hypothetical protein [Acetobacteraceae bacterium]